jgi:hypothetical protein
MKIQIEQHEVEAAVREYMANQGIKVEGKTLSVEFKMTRADGGGLVANLIIEDAAPAATTKAAPKPRANTVGSAVAAQADKAGTQTTGSVNKLPTAAEAIADAQAKAAEAKQEGAGAGEQTAAAATTTTETSAAAEQAAEAGSTGGEAKTTTSLFG